MKGGNGGNSCIAHGGGGGGGCGYFGGGGGRGYSTQIGSGGGGGGSTYAANGKLSSVKYMNADSEVPGGPNESGRNGAAYGGAPGQAGKDGLIILTIHE